MIGSILQINVSLGDLPKRPVGRARVTHGGIEGDLRTGTALPPDPRKALLLVASETVDEQAKAGYPVYYGALGENITTRGIPPEWMRAGQRYRLGPALIELTGPGEAGYYAAVIETGEIRPGDPVVLVEQYA